MKILMILGLMLTAAACPAAPRPVTLSDGTVLQDALMVRLDQATYIVQTADQLYELSEDELDPSTLRDRDFRKQKPPITTHHYDEIHPDGTVTSYWSLPVNNRGKKAITDVRFGLAPWERLFVDQRSYVDDRGLTLIPTYDPPRSKWAKDPDKRIVQTLPLAVPLAPGESMTITGSETSAEIRRTDEGLVYMNPGNYSEDRLTWRKVRMPQGAKILRVSPQPSARFKQDGCDYLMWRRYYTKLEVYPLEVVFTLD